MSEDFEMAFKICVMAEALFLNADGAWVAMQKLLWEGKPHTPELESERDRLWNERTIAFGRRSDAMAQLKRMIMDEAKLLAPAIRGQ